MKIKDFLSKYSALIILLVIIIVYIVVKLININNNDNSDTQTQTAEFTSYQEETEEYVEGEFQIYLKELLGIDPENNRRVRYLDDVVITDDFNIIVKQSQSIDKIKDYKFSDDFMEKYVEDDGKINIEYRLVPIEMEIENTSDNEINIDLHDFNYFLYLNSTNNLAEIAQTVSCTDNEYEITIKPGDTYTGEAVYLIKYKFIFGSNVFRFSDDYNGPLDKKWALIC